MAFFEISPNKIEDLGGITRLRLPEDLTSGTLRPTKLNRLHPQITPDYDWLLFGIF
jgi:hypothetical protein